MWYLLFVTFGGACALVTLKRVDLSQEIQLLQAQMSVFYENVFVFVPTDFRARDCSQYTSFKFEGKIGP